VHKVNLASAIPYISQGLSWIGASLLKAGHEVKVIDALIEGWSNQQKCEDDSTYIGLTAEEIKSRLKNYSPDLVGIGVPFSTQAKMSLLCARLSKEVFPDVPVVMGGNHVTVLPESVARDKNVDYVVTGEGEVAMVYLAASIGRGEKPEAIPGVGYVNESGIFHLTKAEYIKDLNSLPLPAYHLMPMEEYFKQYKCRYMTIMTSRGCPYNCSFCSVHAVHGHKFRPRNVQHVIDEIAMLKDRFGITDLSIEDDNFTADYVRTEQIFSNIVSRNFDLSIYLRNGVRSEFLDHKLLALMKKGGLKKIWLAPESGSRRIREEVIGKKIKMENIYKAVREASELGICVGIFLVIGFPDETKAEIEETFALAGELRMLGANYIWFSVATPYFGTRLYREAIKMGCLEDIDPALLNTNAVSINCKNITKDELIRLRGDAMEKYNKPIHLSLRQKIISSIKHPKWALTAVSAKLANRLWAASLINRLIIERTFVSRLKGNPPLTPPGRGAC